MIDIEELKKIRVALNDSVVLNATEMCNVETINATKKRVIANGGTLAYFAYNIGSVTEMINKLEKEK